MARQLWFLRHGEAEPHGARPDAERRLTPRGEGQARAAGGALRRMGVEFERVLTSPKVRALDTARLALEQLTDERRIEIHEPLAEGFDARDAIGLLAGSGADARVLVVGHEPDFSRTVAELAGGRIDIKKGGLAAVRWEGASGELLLLARPRELELIAGG